MSPCRCDEHTPIRDEDGDLLMLTCPVCGLTVIKDRRQDAADARIFAGIAWLLTAILLVAAIIYTASGDWSGVIWSAFTAAASAMAAVLVRVWGRS